MNIQHSSRTDMWFTPIDIIERARRVLGEIDLDPASCAEANERVKAAKYYTEAENGLTLPWYGKIFCNPPGGKTGNKSNTVLFWQKLMDSDFEDAIFLCFSLEAMQTTQQAGNGVASYAFCVPRRRIAFDKPDGTRGKAPSHSNCIVYVHRRVDASAKFVAEFEDLGTVRL